MSTQRKRCAVCHTPLIGKYYTIEGSDNRYCPTCIATRPRCDSCGVPLGSDYWKLHDGRNQCGKCHSTAIYDPALAQTLFDETVAGIVNHLNLVVHSGVALRLVDLPDLRAVHHRSPPQSTDHSPSASDEPRTLGLYVRKGNTRVIYMLYGLPRLIFRTTLAHEYTHAWQSENCQQLQDDFLREGFAEWVAFYHLLWLGATKAARCMMKSTHPYRPALERLFELERNVGQQGVIEYIKRVV
jgi:hypothetical protein